MIKPRSHPERCTEAFPRWKILSFLREEKKRKSYEITPEEREAPEKEFERMNTSFVFQEMFIQRLILLLNRVYERRALLLPMNILPHM